MATYLYRTNSTSSNTYTFSAWLKHSQVGVNDYKGICLFGTDRDVSSTMALFITNVDKWNVYNGSIHNPTDAVARDPSAWYHLVLKVDNLSGTIYINGESVKSGITCKATGTVSNRMIIGAYGQSGNEDYFGGLMSHVHFSDGYAYNPSVFGSTDSVTGEWKINTNPTFTLGTSGFTILKDGNTITDQSSNSNNFTLGGGTLTKTEDNPSNVFNVLNSINPSASNFTLSNGNTTISKSGAGQLGGYLGTIMPITGKWYWEAKIIEAANGDRTRVGVANYESVTGTSTIQGNYSGLEVACKAAQIFVVTNGSTSETYASGTFADGDIVQLAMDLDNKAIYVGKNGTYVTLTGTSGGDPTSGANKTGAIVTDTTHILNGSPMCVYFGHYAGASDDSNISFNFGNGFFGTTAVSSAGTNASNNGIFEYDVPSGYTALSTKGLNL